MRNIALCTLILFATAASMAMARPAGLALGGTNIGGALRASEYSAWCQGQIGALLSARINARRWLDRRALGNPTQGLANRGAALAELMAGLEAATIDAPTLVGVGLKRGLQLFTRLTDEGPSTPEDLDLLIDALDRFYSFLIVDVYEKLDQATIPNWINQIEHSQEQYLELERRYLDFVAAQLTYLNSAFATHHPSGEGVPRGVGDKFYMIAAERIIDFVVIDLTENSLFRDRYACVARDLRGIRDALGRENLSRQAGDRFKFTLTFDAVQSAEAKLKSSHLCGSKR